jgi:hypothetical protein
MLCSAQRERNTHRVTGSLQHAQIYVEYGQQQCSWKRVV